MLHRAAGLRAGRNLEDRCNFVVPCNASRMERLVLCLSKDEKQTEGMLGYPVCVKDNRKFNTFSRSKTVVQRQAKRLSR